MGERFSLVAVEGEHLSNLEKLFRAARFRTRLQRTCSSWSEASEYVGGWNFWRTKEIACYDGKWTVISNGPVDPFAWKMLTSPRACRKAASSLDTRLLVATRCETSGEECWSLSDGNKSRRVMLFDKRLTTSGESLNGEPDINADDYSVYSVFDLIGFDLDAHLDSDQLVILELAGRIPLSAILFRILYGCKYDRSWFHG